MVQERRSCALMRAGDESCLLGNAHTTGRLNTSGHFVNYSVAPSGKCGSSLRPVSVVARGRSREKRGECVIADAKDRVCETRNTMEISMQEAGQVFVPVLSQLLRLPTLPACVLLQGHDVSMTL